jgi:hypothetical protein
MNLQDAVQILNPLSQHEGPNLLQTVQVHLNKVYVTDGHFAIRLTLDNEWFVERTVYKNGEKTYSISAIHNISLLPLDSKEPVIDTVSLRKNQVKQLLSRTKGSVKNSLSKTFLPSVSKWEVRKLDKYSTLYTLTNPIIKNATVIVGVYHG